jgi:succinate dehydrogenase flavin-adding protein (antitoxin of CptAB toxin-antitoxin module)
LDKDIFELIGGEKLPEEKKKELYQKIGQTIENRAIARLDDQLSDADREEWLKLLDLGDKAKMEAFLKSKNIDISKIIVEEALVYKLEITKLFESTNNDKE